MLVGCATHGTRLRTPSEIKKPEVVNSVRIDESITHLEKTLESASSRAERIELLIEAIQ